MRAYIAALLATVALASNKPQPAGAWDYRQGGEDWGTVYASTMGLIMFGQVVQANNICGKATSTSQSPVDLSTTTALADKDLNIVIAGLGQSSKASRDKATTNMETNWQFAFGDWKNSSTITRTDGTTKAETFTPYDIVWHTPSEHSVDGKHYAAEAQISGTDAAGNITMVGFFFDNEGQDSDNDFVKSFLQGYGDRFNEDANTKLKIDMDLITRKVVEEEGFWQYDGSITTPPCTEGVKWTVMKTVQNISTSQLGKFYQFTKGTASGNELNATEAKYLDYVKTNTANALNAAGNNRKVQPVGTDRKVYWKNDDTTADGVTNVDYNAEDDAASALIASAFTAAAVTLLSF